MKTLIMSSSFTVYKQDEHGSRVPQVIDNINGFKETLQKHLIKRNLYIAISGNPNKKRTTDPLDLTRKGFELSGIPFKNYLYIDSCNKQLLEKHIKQADCIQLHGGHLPTANAFINELNLKELIKDFNGVILGASGGAMNLANDVYCIPEESGEPTDPKFKRHLLGCGLTSINIIPHWGLFKNMQINGLSMVKDILLKDSQNFPLIALPDGSYMVQTDTSSTIFGEAYLLYKGQVKQLCQQNKSVCISAQNLVSE